MFQKMFAGAVKKDLGMQMQRSKMKPVGGVKRSPMPISKGMVKGGGMKRSPMPVKATPFVQKLRQI